jgi:lipopolysaccharide export system permease protein
MNRQPLPNRRLGRVFIYYVIRELAALTTLVLAGLTLFVLTKDLLGFSDLVINRGFGALAVVSIACYEVVPILVRTLPFAVLIGTLIGLGRLRADREILALEAAGISSRGLLTPVLLGATAATIVGLLLSLTLAPWATRSLADTLQQMVRENPGLSLRAGTVHEFRGVKLVAREVSARGNQLRGVLLWLPERGQTIFAERGELIPQRAGVMQLVLFDGVMLVSPRNSGEETRFETFWQTLREESAPKPREEELLTGASLERLSELTRAETSGEDLARRARNEWHRRFAYPVASLFFALLAVSLALAGQSFSRAVGGVAGLLVTVIYYGLIQLGDGLMQARLLSVASAVWLPNLFMGVIAALVFWHEQLSPLWRRRSGKQNTTTVALPGDDAPSLHPRRYLLQRYVGLYYLQMLGVAFAVLLIGYLLIDVLERLQWFARYHADTLKVLRFYGARIPLLASRVIPMALLLATALTVSLLSVHRELLGMRACGVSAVRALLPVLLIAGIVVPGYFLWNEVVVPRSNAWADQLKDREIKARVQEAGPLSTMIWYRAGTQVYQAAQLDPKIGEAQELSIYDLGADGLPVSRTDARAARYVGDGIWELVDPVRVEISAQGLRETPAETRAQLGEAPSETLDTMHLSVRDLAREIRDTEANGYDATTYRVDFHARLAAPLTCLLLPAVALFLAIGGPPFPGPALTIVFSTVLGVGYILLTGVCASLGYGGFLPPSLAGWGPGMSLAALVGLLARRSQG